MRILHTADWHVGKQLAGRSRLDEAEAALKEVAAIAIAEKVDAVLVCGDLYEHSAPSPEAETIVYETLLALERAGIAVVIIPGNHDAPGRWHAVAPLLDRFKVRVVAKVMRPDSGGVVEVPSRDGATVAQVAALPWVSERRMVSAVDLMGLAGEPGQVYADEMGRLMRAMTAALDPRKCTLFAGHLFVSGAALGGGERSLTVGQTYGVTPAALPQVQYAALGHVHRPQRVPGAAAPARYAGSLLQLDFGEAEQRKSVVVVDVSPGKPAAITEIPINAGRRLIEVAGTMTELAAHRESEATSFLHVKLSADGPQPGLADRVREMLPHAVKIELVYPRTEIDQAPPLRGLTPRQQFARYYHTRHGTGASDAMLDLFDELLGEAEEA